MDGIRLKSVSARFRHQVKGDIAAVRDVSLDVAPGELMTLLGPSGCGKTTTLRMIAGFQEPSGGEIFIGDRDVTQTEANERNIGFVFQNYALFPHLSVFENVAYGLTVKRMDGGDIARAVTDVLALVGLASYERQMPHQLSGGEQQRVALARAIVIKPRVLLFDEPLSNLDAKLRTQMRGEIRDLQRRLGITTVYVTHDQEEAMAISDRIAVMNRGLIEQLGTAEELYRLPASVFVARFIGRSNLVEALVTAVSPDRVDLTIAGQPHAVEGAGANVNTGQTVLANVRPEAIAIGAPGNGLAGRVKSRTYLGEKMEYEVEVAGQTVQIVRFNPPPSERFAPGDAVSVRLPHEGVQLLAKEGT
ncbi:MAG: iron(III) transport system ATP-binding protein [Hyphomicrobiales bacterium]|jgi:iron(III) transport system ATP-binding protein|nr:iron(III) transport system ATP-binding protein [Hyphomicrobiales bacterium]